MKTKKKTEPSLAALTVRLHRWQPKQNRYKIQPFSLDPGETGAEVITDILFRRAMFEKDATVNQIIARTQQVDRVMINTLDSTVDIWMSPTVERVYNKVSIAQAGKASGFKKPTAADHVCDCGHARRDHANNNRDAQYRTGSTHGLCLVPGCRCDLYIEPIRERRERPGHAQVPARPVTELDPITNDDIGI